MSTTTTASKTRTARIASPLAPPSSALAKLGGGHDGHRPRNADGGDRRLPPAHAPPRATATTTTTTTTRGGGCRGRSWRTPPRWQWTSSWRGGRGRWWRATTTATTTAKEGILPYRTVPLPAATGTTTTRRRGCGVAGGRPTEEGGGNIAGTTTMLRRLVPPRDLPGCRQQRWPHGGPE